MPPRRKRARAAAPPPTLPTPATPPTTSEEVLARVVQFGDVPPEEIVCRTFNPESNLPKGPAPELVKCEPASGREEPLRRTALLLAPNTGGGEAEAAALAAHGQMYLENVNGVGIGAATHEALDERRAGVLLGQAHERERVRGIIGPALGFPQGAIAATSAPAAPLLTEPTITDKHIMILKALSKARPATLKMADLEAKTQISRRTIGPYLTELRDRGLTHRPRGERSGDTITTQGIALLESLDAPH
jgi:hypothetical protein